MTTEIGLTQEDAERAQAIIDNLRRRLAATTDALIAAESELEMTVRKFSMQQQIIEALVQENRKQAADVDAEEDTVAEASAEGEASDVND